MSMFPDIRRRGAGQTILLAVLALALAWAAGGLPAIAGGPASPVPAAILDEPAPPGAASETAVLAGGCFWGVQAVFQHVKGVRQAVSAMPAGRGRRRNTRP